MIQPILSQIGGTLAAVVGPVHDALGGKNYAPSKEVFAEGSPSKGPLEFYVGGTAVVTAVATLLLCGKKKPVRRRRRKTTPARRRRMYSRK